MVPITVVIPVGPYPGNIQWLGEAVRSVQNQTYPQGLIEILFINDGAWAHNESPDVSALHSMYTPPWRLGVGHAFNFGVALAPTECVFMMGSDDILDPDCLELCAHAYETIGRDAYYWVPVQYIDSGQVQFEVCNAAMVTKGFWRKSGGFPIEATTAPDAALNSIMMTHPELERIRVGDRPLYYYRSHDDTDTRKHGEWWQTVIDIRNHVTREWVRPEWTRNFVRSGIEV